MLNWRASVSVALPQTGTLHRRVLKNPGHLVGRRALDLLPEPLLDQVIGAEPALAGAAVDQRIVEILDVTGRLPNARMHQDAGIEPDDVAPLVHESSATRGP